MCCVFQCGGLEFLDKDDTVMTGKNLQTAPMYLLRQTLYNGHLLGPVTYTCCWAFGSGAVTTSFNDLSLSRPGIESRFPYARRTLDLYWALWPVFNFSINIYVNVSIWYNCIFVSIAHINLHTLTLMNRSF